MDQQESFFAEVVDAINIHQPRLDALKETDGIKIHGTFECFDEELPFDRYEVELKVPWTFPLKEPRVWETGGRIPRTVPRHVYPSNGQCCLGLWEIWLVRNTEPTFARFLITHMHSYFVGQTVFEWTDEWVFGEEAHTADGIAESYFEAIEFPEGSDRHHFFRLLTAPLLQANPFCPCGSGERFNNCHKAYVKDLRRRIPAAIRNAMKKRLKGKKGAEKL